MGQPQLNPTRRDLARVRDYARQCEANAHAAREFGACNFHGAAATCAGAADMYSRKAFYLARQVAGMPTRLSRSESAS